MKRNSQILTAAAALLIAGVSLFAQGNGDAGKPVANFGITEPQNGVIKGWAPAVIKVGSATKMDNGPFGAKALKFNGSDAAVCVMDYTAMQKRIEQAETVSIALAIRLDAISDTPVYPGFGFLLEGNKLSFTNGTYKLTATEPLATDKWYQVAVTCSKNEMKLYLDGQFNNLLPMKLSGKVLSWFNPGGSFGKFNGALASMQIWDRAVDATEVIRIDTDSKGLDVLINDIQKVEKTILTDTIKPYLAATVKEVEKIKNTRKTTVRNQQYAANIGMTALKLAKAEVLFRKTSLAKAPFAMVQIQTTSRQMRNPEKFPEDPQYTGCVRVAAARGEYEPAAFLIYGYKELPDFTITVSDFKDDKGNLLPASILDQKLVAYLPRNGWNSIYYSNVKQNVPDLLVNSEDTIRYSASGDLILEPGKKLPKADAKTIQPVQVIPNQAKHFWFTFKIPQDAKPGLYQATATARSGGAAVGSFPIQLRVYPFALPAPKTNYDRKTDYMTIVVGETNANTVSAEQHKINLQNAIAHNINRPVIQCAAVNDIAKDLEIRKSLGMDLKDSIVALYPDNGTLMTDPDKTFSALSDGDLSKSINSAMNAFKSAGANFYFYGATAAFYGNNDETAAAAWNNLVSKGAKVITSGNSEAAYSLPALDLLHARAYAPDYLQTEKWHAMKGRLISCGKQLVVYNPDTMRRFFGLTLYRENYDGFFLSSFSSDPDVWTKDRTGIFHRQNLSYPTLSGTPINTIAYEALREGIDDVRYITLMRMLVDEAFASGNQDAIYAAKKAVSTFELFGTGRMDLDLVRMDVVEHIITLLKVLGKD